MSTQASDVIRISRRHLVAAAAAGLCGGAASPGAGAVHDLMPDFWAAYDRTRTAGDRTSALIAAFFEPHRDVYEGAGLKVDAALVSRWLPRLDGMAQDVRRLSAAFPGAYARHVADFRAHFPSFDPAGAPVYAMPSLFDFDGHLYRWGDRIPLFLGLDGIVRYHGADPSLAVILDHETFHLLQNSASPEMLKPPTPLWVRLWHEGGATYVSRRLNPAASRTDVLASADLARVPETAIPKLAKDFLARFDSTDDADVARYFSASWRGETPARSGYLLGLSAFEIVGRDLSLAQLADRPAPEARDRLRKAVSTLAT